MFREFYRMKVGRGIKMIIWYPIKRRYHLWQIGRIVRSRDIGVLVYQMGKVASKSIEKSLRGVRGIQVFHLHNLSSENIKIQETALREFLDTDDVAHFFEAGRLVHQHLVGPGHQLKIITLVREPIGRNVSAYFQNLDDWWGMRASHLNVPMKDLVDTYKRKFPHDEPLRWFDREFRSATGIDVYDTPFSHADGYGRIRSAQFDVLVMRHDLNDDVKARCIRDFLGLGDIVLKRENTSEEKSYAEAYRRFRDALNFDEAYVDHMLESRFARHFYSESERMALKRKWLRSGTMDGGNGAAVEDERDGPGKQDK